MKKIAAVVVTSGALLMPGSALASGSCQKNSSSTYETGCHNLGSVEDTGASRSNTPASSGTAPSVSSVDSENATRSASPSTASELPFTGIDIVPLVAGGAALLGAGLFVRRISRDER